MYIFYCFTYGDFFDFNVLIFCFVYLSVSSCLKPSLELNVNLLTIYDKQKPVRAFMKEVTTLAHKSQSDNGEEETEEA